MGGITDGKTGERRAGRRRPKAKIEKKAAPKAAVGRHNISVQALVARECERFIQTRPLESGFSCAIKGKSRPPYTVTTLSWTALRVVPTHSKALPGVYQVIFFVGTYFCLLPRLCMYRRASFRGVNHTTKNALPTQTGNAWLTGDALMDLLQLLHRLESLGQLLLLVGQSLLQLDLLRRDLHTTTADKAEC